MDMATVDARGTRKLQLWESLETAAREFRQLEVSLEFRLTDEFRRATRMRLTGLRKQMDGILAELAAL